MAVAEFGAALLGPQGAARGLLGKEDSGEIPEFLSGVEEIDDRDDLGELFLNEAPDPGGTNAKDDLAVDPGEAPAIRCASSATVEI